MKINQLTKSQQIHHSIIYMLPVGLGILLPFITIPIFTRILSPEDYGILALAMIYAIFINGLANCGMSLAFERNYFKYNDSPERLAQLFFSTLIFVLINFTLFAVLTYLFMDNISLFLTGSDQYGFFIFTTLSAHFFSSTILNFYFIYLKNKEEAKINAKCKIYSSLLNFIIALILVAYMKIGILGIILGQLISGILMFLFMLYLLLKELRFSFSKKILFETLNISYPLLPGTFVKVIITQFDKYMISLLATIGGVGIYHIGRTVSNVVFVFMTAIENVFNPQVYQRLFDEDKKRSNSIGIYLTPFLYVSIFIALIVALFSEELISILTPPSYHLAIPIITILSMYSGILFFAKVTSIQLVYVKKTHILSVLAFITLGLNVGLNIPFIIKYGAVGAAWATLFSGLIAGVLKLRIAQHYHRILYEWRKIAWIMGIFFIGVNIIVLMQLYKVSYYWLLTVKFICLSLFLDLGIKYGVISKKNLRIITSIIWPFKALVK